MKKVLFFTIILSFIMSSNLFSFPAFARKYSMTCKTCHSPFPRLKPYGDEFAANGFTIPDKDAPRYFTDTGDDELSLLRELPIGIRFEGYLNFNNSKSDYLDFSAPYIIKLISGGELTKNLAYYFYFFFNERGDIAGVEDAFLMFNDLFGVNLDLYVGQFQVSDPLFKRELRLPFEDYQVYKIKPGFSQIDLTYDRGVMITYGLPSGTDFTLEILNGNGISAADSKKLFDNDKYKNFMGRVSQDIGEHLRLGGLIYTGKEMISNVDNKVQMFGGDFTFGLENLEINFQYVHRKDDNPIFTTFKPEEIKSDGIMGELIFLPKGDDSKWYGLALYNYVKSDQKDLEYNSYTVSFGYLLRRNIRIVGEYTYYNNNDKKYGKIGIGFVSAF